MTYLGRCKISTQLQTVKTIEDCQYSCNCQDNCHSCIFSGQLQTDIYHCRHSSHHAFNQRLKETSWLLYNFEWPVGTRAAAAIRHGHWPRKVCHSETPWTTSKVVYNKRRTRNNNKQKKNSLIESLLFDLSKCRYDTNRDLFRPLQTVNTVVDSQDNWWLSIQLQTVNTVADSQDNWRLSTQLQTVKITAHSCILSEQLQTDIDHCRHSSE